MSEQLNSFLSSIGQFELIDKLNDFGCIDVDFNTFKQLLKSENQSMLGLNPVLSFTILARLENFLSNNGQSIAVGAPAIPFALDSPRAELTAVQQRPGSPEFSPRSPETNVSVQHNDRSAGSVIDINESHRRLTRELDIDLQLSLVMKRVRGKFSKSPTMSLPGIPNDGVLFRPLPSNDLLLHELKGIMGDTLCQQLGLTPLPNDALPVETTYSYSLTHSLATSLCNIFLKYFVIISKEELARLVSFLIFDKKQFHEPTMHYAEKVTRLVISMFYESPTRTAKVDEICRERNIEKKTIPHWASTSRMVTSHYLTLQILGHDDKFRAISDAIFLHFSKITFGKLEAEEKKRCLDDYEFAIEIGVYDDTMSFEEFEAEKERIENIRKAQRTAQLASRRTTAAILSHETPTTSPVQSTSARLSRSPQLTVEQQAAVGQQLEARRSRATSVNRLGTNSRAPSQSGTLRMSSNRNR